jgi:hypothetical protein
MKQSPLWEPNFVQHFLSSLIYFHQGISVKAVQTSRPVKPCTPVYELAVTHPIVTSLISPNYGFFSDLREGLAAQLHRG